MAEESLPGSSKRLRTSESTSRQRLVRHLDYHDRDPIPSTLAHPGHQHRMGRLDDLGGLGWDRPFHRLCPHHDQPWHGQRHLDRRPERHHLHAQAVLLGTVHLSDHHCFDKDLYRSSLPGKSSLVIKSRLPKH